MMLAENRLTAGVINVSLCGISCCGLKWIRENKQYISIIHTHTHGILNEMSIFRSQGKKECIFGLHKRRLLLCSAWWVEVTVGRNISVVVILKADNVCRLQHFPWGTLFMKLFFFLLSLSLHPSLSLVASDVNICLSWRFKYLYQNFSRIPRLLAPEDKIRQWVTSSDSYGS